MDMGHGDMDMDHGGMDKGHGSMNMGHGGMDMSSMVYLFHPLFAKHFQHNSRY